MSSYKNIVECLKKARLIAKYYNDNTVLSWIVNELIGYHYNTKVPQYRKVVVIDRIYDQPISYEVRSDIDEILARAKTGKDFVTESQIGDDEFVEIETSL